MNRPISTYNRNKFKYQRNKDIVRRYYSEKRGIRKPLRRLAAKYQISPNRVHVIALLWRGKGWPIGDDLENWDHPDFVRGEKNHEKAR